MVSFQWTLRLLGTFGFRTCGGLNCSRRATVRLGIDTLISNILATVASLSLQRQRRLLYFRSVIFIFFPPEIFRRSWADFRETLPYDAVWPELLYLLYGCSYVRPKTWGAKKTFFANFRAQNRHFEPRHSLMRGKSENVKDLWLGEDVHTKHGWGYHHPTPKIGCPVDVWGGASKFWIDITSAVWQLATRCLILEVGFRGQSIR